MMRQGLTKSVTVHSSSYSASFEINLIAKQIVIDYFSRMSRNGLDIFAVSQGLMFSKVPNRALNAQITNYFNQLFNTLIHRGEISRETGISRAALLNEINLSRTASSGPELTLSSLIRVHPERCRDYLFALYLEFMLSKTSNPKEMSDLIGLQNRLHQKEATLVSAAGASAGASAGAGGPLAASDFKFFSHIGLSSDDLGVEILKAIVGMNPTMIRRAEVESFVNSRIPDSSLREMLKAVILTANNDDQRALTEISENMPTIQLESAMIDLSTNESSSLGRGPFESRTVLAMFGTDAERTGYSHEPVGLVGDIASNPETLASIALFTSALLSDGKDGTIDLSSALIAIESLIEETFSYDEKTQMGGRALRTPSGEAILHEYLSTLNQTIKLLDQGIAEMPIFAFRALRVETSFADIFTPDFASAELARISVEFNRTVFLKIKSLEAGASLAQALAAVTSQFAAELANHKISKTYCDLIQERLPLLWAMRHSSELASAYLTSLKTTHPNENLFEDSRREIQHYFETHHLPHLPLEFTEDPHTAAHGAARGTAESPSHSPGLSTLPALPETLRKRSSSSDDQSDDGAEEEKGGLEQPGELPAISQEIPSLQTLLDACHNYLRNVPLSRHKSGHAAVIALQQALELKDPSNIRIAILKLFSHGKAAERRRYFAANPIQNLVESLKQQGQIHPSLEMTTRCITTVKASCETYLAHTKTFSFMHTKGRDLVTQLTRNLDSYAANPNQPGVLDELHKAALAIYEGTAKRRETDIPIEQIQELLANLPRRSEVQNVGH